MNHNTGNLKLFKMIFISKGLEMAIKLLLMTYRSYTMIKSFIKLGTKVFVIIHLYLYLEIGTDGIYLILYFKTPSPLLRRAKRPALRLKIVNKNKLKK
jgi:hypothetical protein